MEGKRGTDSKQEKGLLGKRRHEPLEVEPSKLRKEHHRSEAAAKEAELMSLLIGGSQAGTEAFSSKLLHGIKEIIGRVDTGAGHGGEESGSSTCLVSLISQAFREGAHSERERLMEKERILKEREEQIQKREQQLNEEERVPLKDHLSVVQNDEKHFFEVLPHLSEEEGLLKLPQGSYWMGIESLGSSMLVRACYKKLFEIASERVDGNVRTRRMLITGTPGIGKSFFAYYCLYRFMKQGRSIVFESDPACCYFWRPKRQLEVHSREHILRTLDEPDILYLIDSRMDVGKKLKCAAIMFSSPREANFHDFVKNGAKMFFMPLWGDEELEEARSKVYNGMVSASRMRAIRTVYGPIPRYVLFESTSKDFAPWTEEEAGEGRVSLPEGDRLGRAIANVTLESLMRLRDVLLPDDDYARTYGHQIVHIDADSTFRNATRQWASQFVMERLFQRKADAMVEIATSVALLADETTAAKAFAGKAFEHLMHQVLASGCQEFEIRRLGEAQDVEIGPNLPMPRIPKERMAIHSFPVLDQVKVLQGVYFKPKIANFPSADSFILAGEHLLIFQISVGKNHPVKANGLRKIIRKMIGKERPDGRVFLIFVVPEVRYRAYKKQKYMCDKMMIENCELETMVDQFVLSFPKCALSAFLSVPERAIAAIGLTNSA